MDAPEADSVVADAVCQYGASMQGDFDELLLLCIGTDRSIGDALGPLIGSQLSEMINRPFSVLGTLDNPVHASNLAETVDQLRLSNPRALIIAVDACLGRAESVGLITIGKGSLKPGAGVNKSLPAVGHIYVTGIVNVGGFMEYFVLQNTRLSLVMRMAKIAATGICEGMSALHQVRSESGLLHGSP